MSRSLVVVAVSIALTATGCSLVGAAGGGPVHAIPPSVAPSAVRRTGNGSPCIVRRASSDVRPRGLVGVDPHPAGVIAVWLPGMNEHPCRAALTRGNSELARRLAKDIAKAPKWPSGAYNCPSDDGTRAELYFQQPEHAEAELVDVDLAGCKGLDAPGRVARQMTEEFSHDLASIAPVPWRNGL
jgi:hypothetical protein